MSGPIASAPSAQTETREQRRVVEAGLIGAATFSSRVVALILAICLASPSLAVLSASEDHPGTDHHSITELRPIEKIEYSEFNHHGAGAALFILALIALAMELGGILNRGLRVTRWLWSAAWLLLGAFLFVRSDPDNWPWGPIGFVETFTDAETLQHKLFAAVAVAIGIAEGSPVAGSRSGDRHGSLRGLTFPILCIASGLLLALHSFVHAHMPRVYWQHLAFAVMGILVGTAKLLRERGGGNRLSPLVWPTLLMLFAGLLLLYTER
ncbi:hypothetical protein ACO9S2_07340 [Nitrospira sp. NS4]|uniref:hypothetical protein n=1 Tax=Nitrospira sp. NS4 TaxID=3414498 RepID=UPI003C2BCC9D